MNMKNQEKEKDKMNMKEEDKLKDKVSDPEEGKVDKLDAALESCNSEVFKPVTGEKVA
jgi:hypothetical protein